MSIALCTICLNELEFLPKLYGQHKDWPDLAAWVFVEGADVAYAQANPGLVSDKGLSIDNTSAYLRQLADRDERVTYIPHGFSRGRDITLGKTAMRQRYLDVLQSVKPDFLVILDADEFYCRDDQPVVNDIMAQASGQWWHWCFKFTHIWHPPVLKNEPLFSRQAVGGFFDMDHIKGHRWHSDLRYNAQHQRPDMPTWNTYPRTQRHDGPYCIHMAFATDGQLRTAKHRYYEYRGEGRTDRRGWYVQTRRAFESWTPENDVAFPRGAKIVPYDGPIPEVFR
jgi:hypothetical protein